ncbi:hypothetical protein HYFRA_00013826 [Hymenoscyphus fraxineus]|uniref:Uncharacterized protein n=1 Tax=Hymenoscyphus fraxineus TaxID=746836 RepID=A0A9N9LBU7_9HELO|nr:hypothetical protein HYFRA_00013826 [Hymenoscyphus fraxineus]
MKSFGLIFLMGSGLIPATVLGEPTYDFGCCVRMDRGGNNEREGPYVRRPRASVYCCGKFGRKLTFYGEDDKGENYGCKIDGLKINGVNEFDKCCADEGKALGFVSWGQCSVE